MRVYMHFEEEDPNYTKALTAAGPETTLDDLLQDFLRSYVEHYGEGAADLDADALELRSSKSAPHALATPPSRRVLGAGAGPMCGCVRGPVSRAPPMTRVRRCVAPLVARHPRAVHAERRTEGHARDGRNHL